MENIDLLQLKSALPPGWRIIISKELKKSLGYIDKVMAGKRCNIEILKIAVDLATKYREDKEYVRRKISDLGIVDIKKEDQYARSNTGNMVN